MWSQHVISYVSYGKKKKQAAIAPFDLDLTKIKGMRTP